MKSFTPPVQAVLMMLMAMALFSAMNIVIRLLSPDMAPTQMVFLRNAVSLGLVVCWQTTLHRRLPVFRTSRPADHFWRAGIGIVAMELWFYAITLLPVTLATALSFTTPIFATIFAILFLGEKAGTRRWGAIAAGFIGTLIILRPGMGGMGAGALVVIASSVMMAVAGVLVKTLTRTEPPEVIVFYMALFMVPLSAAPALLHWQPFDVRQFGLIALIALFSTMAQLLMARAYVRADMVMLMPLDFSRLVFTSIFAYALFGETLDAPTITGSLVIVASAVATARREARHIRV